MMGVDHRIVSEDNLLRSSFLPNVYRIDKIVYFRVRSLNVHMFCFIFNLRDCDICRVSRKKTFLHTANLRSLLPSKNSSHFF